MVDPRLANIYTIENDPSNTNQLVDLLSPTGKWWATGKCLPGGTQGVHYIANPFDRRQLEQPLPSHRTAFILLALSV
jgi:hypothetical protein